MNILVDNISNLHTLLILGNIFSVEEFILKKIQSLLTIINITINRATYFFIIKREGINLISNRQNIFKVIYPIYKYLV